MNDIGMFSVDTTTRRIRGYLVPWNELSRTSIDGTPPVKFTPDTLTLPRTPAVAKLNKDHMQTMPMGMGAMFAVHDAGLYAEFIIDDSDDGDAFLADHGPYVRLSPEVRHLTITGEHATGELTGAALVPEGAFQSAALFARADPDPPHEPDPSGGRGVVPPYLDPRGGGTPAEPEPEPEPDPNTPVPDPPADDSAETESEETMVNATVPTGLPTPAPVTIEEPDPPQGIGARAMFAAMSRVHGGFATPDDVDLVQRGMHDITRSAMFALSDIKYNGTGGIGAVQTPSQWLGEVEDGVEYTSLFAGLFGHQNLTAATITGWRWLVKPQGGPWAGNKAPIPSNSPTVEPVTEVAQYWAGGHDHSREHRDFNTPGYFESYYAAMTESYRRWLDSVILSEALLSATDIEADNPAGLDIGAGWSAVIDGAYTIIQAGLKPTGAVVDGALWKSMAKLPASSVLGYLNSALSLSGDGSLDGFQIVGAPTGALTAGHTLVVARSAADVYELPGNPIRVEAANIAQGGIDTGVFSYGGFLVKNTDGVVDVAPYTATAARGSSK